MAGKETDPLLIATKGYLDITWSDPATNAKISRLIAAGKLYLEDIAGTDLDFSQPGMEQSLLFDYVRYARSGASELFWDNYKKELTALRLRIGVSDYAAKSEND